MIPKLKIIATNATEVSIDKITLYFSYETCVAFSSPEGRFKTEKRYSQTTSKHLGLFGAKEFTPCSEEVFNSLLTDSFHQWTIRHQKEFA